MEKDIKGRIETLERDLKKRISRECEYIKKATNPMHEVNIYIKNIQWESPELAAFLKREMLAILNLNN